MAGTATGAAAAGHHGHAGTPALAGILTALPAFAVAGRPTLWGQASACARPATAVILEADRRNPRRRGVATAPGVPATTPAASTASDSATTPEGQAATLLSIPAAATGALAA